MTQAAKQSFTVKLTGDQQEALVRELRTGNYQPLEVPHARAAGQRPRCKIALFHSGKCLVQGKEARDWVQFVLEPQILQGVINGYEDILNPEAFQPHMGIDESGKGDFFGPLVIAAAYADDALARELLALGVRDSKRITTDRKARDMAAAIRRVLAGRFALVTIGPRAYNRLYASMRNVNRMLAWGHARAIENLLEKVPACPRAIADQFGPTREIERALLKKGRRLELVQRHRAESDPAVAAASVLARDAFLAGLEHISKACGVTAPKGASDRVRAAGVELVRAQGPAALLEVAKCHFRTTDRVLEEAGCRRSDLGPEGAAVSRTAKGDQPT